MSAQTLNPPVSRPPVVADSSCKSAIIRVDGLGKKFRIYPSPWHRLSEWASFGAICRHKDFWALRNVSFTLNRGQSLGVIGINGSGKSTLLKILTGCAFATEGTFSVQGRVLSLLELGTGINPQLTGRENVENTSQLLSFPADYAKQKMPEIEAFSDLGEFFDRPIRVYSSGMIMRLAFSMFASFDPEVFIVDEALSVGDIFFQQKCARRIQEMRRSGTTLLFVSHDMGVVEALCDQVLVLHHGKQEFLGDKVRGVSLYYSLSGAKAAEGIYPSELQTNSPTSSPSRDATPSALSPGTPALGSEAQARRGEGWGEGRSSNVAAPADSAQFALPPLIESELASLPWTSPDQRDKIETGKMQVDAICLRRSDGRPANSAQAGQDMDLFIRLKITEDVRPFNLGISLTDRFNQLVFAQGWLNAQMQPLAVQAGQTVYAAIRFRLDLEPGEEFTIAVTVAESLPDPKSPTGWNQNVGGVRHLLLPRIAVVQVLHPSHGARRWFGPANLQTSHQRMIVNPK